MRRWIAVAAVGGVVLAGCAPGETVRATNRGSTSSTEIAGPRSVSGTVTFENAWAFDSGDFPRTVRNGEECWLVLEPRDDSGDLGPQVVVESGTGVVIGEVETAVGEISGLGPAGFDLPSQLETVLIASESLMRRASCSFGFSIVLPEESPSYSFVVGGRPGVVYSADDLDALNWVVDLGQD